MHTVKGAVTPNSSRRAARRPRAVRLGGAVPGPCCARRLGSWASAKHLPQPPPRFVPRSHHRQRVSPQQLKGSRCHSRFLRTGPGSGVWVFLALAPPACWAAGAAGARGPSLRAPPAQGCRCPHSKAAGKGPVTVPLPPDSSSGRAPEPSPN